MKASTVRSGEPPQTRPAEPPYCYRS